MRKVIGTAVLIAVAIVFSVNAYAGSTWSLSSDIVAGANPNPAIGEGTWSFYGNTMLMNGHAAADGSNVNPELPNGTTGYFLNCCNWITAVRADVDAVIAADGGDDKTNFLAGGFGGHADTRARWTTSTGGTYNLSFLGYNARNVATASPGELGRQTDFQVKHLDASGGMLGVIHDNKLGGLDGDGNSLHNGIANADTGTAQVSLAAGESIEIGHGGGDWAGYDITISRVPEPCSVLLVSIVGLALGFIRRR